ncbi:hypothetical protein HanPI659440_Chr07g0263101 [Helianthus annuus]|nr:hypothetical protein HanPI659440_Chr07g0263101 [Helianthus annuus]
MDIMHSHKFLIGVDNCLLLLQNGVGGFMVPFFVIIVCDGVGCHVAYVMYYFRQSGQASHEIR